MKHRVTARVLSHLSGSQAWQSPTPTYNNAVDVALMAKLRDARRRADGSTTVDLADDEAAVLREYVDVMAIAAADNAGPGDPDATADLNAARAMLRRLDREATR
ncbi:hypothetical protein I5J47_gp71 [Mycobacterium phage Arib1]|uniref:Uncharacterized protein n=2 Tax=Fishburnevirus TaxID=1983734 RepID=A0A2D1G5R2_9CAUD|nr:hypothetical protein I5J45_gp68 [Mycobacterium phage Bartholomew]YP_009964955.1 hypothetical protein I5J47_gp71 [Mycobacterium phage Arib1]UVK59467.1 hypothetical protein SEA_VENTI_70 [Mycobacterium phage Venti]WRQ08474.1 hypothetical protein JDBV10_00330 [Mycobacterium phage juyeon]ASR86443.1 hypothetical protein SEA_BARTHOLOMEW_68 [Mycobacterium phage Bartholomew]ATN87215.1 hypothetical protein SEA_ARIB1_71 [Mycobacterium phage Arib1]